MNTRALWVAMLLVPLAGCFGFGDEADGDDHDHDCPDMDAMDNDGMDHDGMDVNDTTDANVTGLMVENPLPALQLQANETGNATQMNATVEDDGGHDHDEECPDPIVETPNHAPIAVLDISFEDGTPFGNSSYILPGETLTFSARNSEDHDGTIGLAGLTIVDANGTRSVNLIQNGTMIDAIIKFDHHGLVNVTLRVIDDRGDAGSVSKPAYVNFQETGSQSVELFDPTGGGCEGPLPSQAPPLAQEAFFAKEPFVVSAGARWITVETSNTDSVSICDPAGTEIGSGEEWAETDEGAWAANTQYFLALHPGGANQTMTYDVIVHYEPKPSA